MQSLTERHGLELTLPKARSRDHKLLEIYFDDLVSKIFSKPLSFRFTGNGTFIEYGRGNANVSKELIQQRQRVTGSQRYKRRGVRDNQHQALARKEASSASRSSGG